MGKRKTGILEKIQKIIKWEYSLSSNLTVMTKINQLQSLLLHKAEVPIMTSKMYDEKAFGHKIDDKLGTF
jgi:hypothetical protein